MLPPKSRILRRFQTGWPSTWLKYGNCVRRVETRFQGNVVTGAKRCCAWSVSNCASCNDIVLFKRGSDLYLGGPRERLAPQTVLFGPTIERPRRRVDVAIAAQQLPRDRIRLQQLLLVRRLEIYLRFQPAIRVTINHHLRRALAAIRRGRVKDAVLKQQRVTGVELQIANSDTNRIDRAFRYAQRLRGAARAARQQRHSRLGPIEIRQAVTNLHARERQVC